MPKKTRASKRRRLLVLLGLAALLPFGLAALATTPFAREYARQQAEHAIRTELGLSGIIQDVHVEPRTLSIVASGIVLDHPARGRFVEASRLRIRPSWWALLRGDVDLHTITIHEATVWLTIEDGKLVNGPRVEPSNGGGGGVDLPFNKLWVERSRLRVTAAPHGSGELRDIDLYLDSTRRDVLGVELKSPRGYVQHGSERDEVQGIEARLKLTADNVQVELARLATRDVAFAARRASFELPWRDSYHGEVELRLNLDALQRWPLPVALPPLSGELAVKANLVAEGHAPRGDVRLELTRATIDGYVLGETVELDVQVDGPKLKYAGVVRAIRDGGHVELDGSLELTEGLPLAVRAKVVDVSFAKLMEQLDVSPDAIVSWTLAGQFELAGTLDPLRLTGPLRMPTRDFRVTRDAWHASPSHTVVAVASATLEGGVSVDHRGILLQNIDVAMRHSKLRVPEVLLGFDNQIRVRAIGERFDLRDVGAIVDFPVDGSGGFDVRVEGTFQDPNVGGRLHFDRFAFNTYPFGDVRSEFVLERDFQAVRFPLLVATKNRSLYQAKDFTLDFSDDRLAITTKLAFDRFAMQDFYHVFHYAEDERYLTYQAIVSGETAVRYTMGFPGDSPRGTLRTDMDLRLREIDLSGFAFASGHFNGRFTWFDHAQGYRGGELIVERFALHKADTTLSISGKMAREGKLDMVAVADRVSIRDTEGLAERLPELSGTYRATGTIKGDAASPLAELEVATNGLRYAEHALGDVRAYVRLTSQNDPWVKDALAWPEGKPPADAVCPHAREGLARGVWPEDPPLRTVDGPIPRLDTPMAFLVCGSGFDERVGFDLAIGRTSTYPLRGDIRFSKFQLGRFLSPKKKDASSGTLTGLVRLRGGAMLLPTTLEGDLAFDVVKLGQLGVTVENQGPIRARFAAGEFELEPATFTGPSTVIQISGGASLLAGLALEVNGHLDLGILPSFAPQLRAASGRLSAQVKLSGRLERPSVFGQARVEGGKLQLAAVSFPIEGLEASATFSEQRVLLERASAELLGGHVRVQGDANLQGRHIDSVRLELAGQRIAFTPREGIELVVGGRGDLAWHKGDRLPKLTGTLRLDRATYKRPITMGRTLRDLSKTTRADVDGYNPDNDMLALDLSVVQSQPMRVANNLIDAEIAIDDSKDAFRLVGTDQRFGVLGRMNIRRGTVRLRNTAFEIKQGDITFDNATRVEPSFDVHAETEVRHASGAGHVTWQIAAHAWGTPESFRFSLTSNPHLSEDDIALLLAVGVTQTELAQYPNDMTGTAALEALATVTGVDREVQRALPAIDEVRIASSYSQRSQRTEPQLHLGKRIADRVRMEASTSLSEARDFSTGVEYQISDKTSVGAAYNNQTATSASQLGDVGVDLKWRLEFD